MAWVKQIVQITGRGVRMLCADESRITGVSRLARHHVGRSYCSGESEKTTSLLTQSAIEDYRSWNVFVRFIIVRPR